MKILNNFKKTGLFLISALLISSCSEDESTIESLPYSMRATDYEEFKHFFLGQFFRDNYENWLSDLPHVNSGVNVTRVEVYIVNNNSETASVTSSSAEQLNED